ncbi:MAG TPA: hypothetical protein P5207_01095, partial [Candidatus Sabulitectum sp.]|nr:hypothetical protein [Candidatus Sabulitectum sp.]
MTSEGSRRVLNAGFAAILVLVAAGAATDTLIPVAAGVSFLLIALMVFACPPRMAALLFTVQVVLTTLFLARLGFYAGPFPIRIDDAIQIWIFIMWIGAVIDGEGAVKSTGISSLILVLMALSVASFIHGVARGYDPESAGLFLKTMLGYLFYFPAMWLLGK